MAVVKVPKPVPLLCLDIEIAVAKHFDYRSHVIVPNISWGLGFMHEIDVLVMTKTGFCREIEIKTSRADLKRDLLKRHQHQSPFIRQHFLAVPKALAEFALATFPETWGVISVAEDTRWVETRRHAHVHKSAKPLPEEKIRHLYELASMRTWTLKETLAGRIHRAKLPVPL